MKYLKISKKNYYIFIITSLGVLTTFYIKYVDQINADLFFESQFLHITFLNDLIRGSLTWGGFFTTFGEHLFPGYNLLLGINYKFFNVWGGFDAIIFLLSSIASTIIVIIGVDKLVPGYSYKKIILIIISQLIILSPVNNPQWGMALAANFGVTLFLLSVVLINFGLIKNNLREIIYALLIGFISIVLFLGGYSVGAICANLTIAFLYWLETKKTKFSIYIVVVTAASFFIYISLVLIYGSLLSNAPANFLSNIGNIVLFTLIMMGASVLGRAYYELNMDFSAYYILGSILIISGLILLLDFRKNKRVERLFFIALYAYSLSNILAVSLFRFRNGLDGALGQWYNSHTHLLAISSIYALLFCGDHIKNSLLKNLKNILLLLLILFILIGYYCDWKKAPYIKPWKEQFIGQALVLLTSPESIADINNPMNTMLWNSHQAKAGVELLYDRNLWIFSNKAPRIFGVEADGWIKASDKISILCPSSSKSIAFKIFRPIEYPQSVVGIVLGKTATQLKIGNREEKFIFNDGPRVMVIDPTDKSKSLPFIHSPDVRPLVALISDISCN